MFRTLIVEIIAFEILRMFNLNMASSISLHNVIHKTLKTIHPAKVLPEDHITLIQFVKKHSRTFRFNRRPLILDESYLVLWQHRLSITAFSVDRS